MLEKKVRFLLTEHHAQHFPDGKGKNGEDLVSKDLTEEGVLHPQIWQDPTGTAPSIRNSTDQVSLKENCEFLARMSPIESIKMEGDKTRILAVYQSAAERYFKVSIYYLLVLGFFFTFYTVSSTMRSRTLFSVSRYYCITNSICIFRKGHRMAANYDHQSLQPSPWEKRGSSVCQMKDICVTLLIPCGNKCFLAMLLQWQILT